MAKEGMANTPWLRASELHVRQKESRLPQLQLSQLTPFIPLGLERGSLIEISGSKSSGKTSTLLYILATSLSSREVCAYIDLRNQFDPSSLSKLGLSPSQLSWVRCHGNTEHALRSADLLLHAGGFGVVLLDLFGASAQELNRIPISYWFRFRRAVEGTPTIVLICSEYPQARSCCSLSLEIRPKRFCWLGQEPFLVLDGLETSLTPRKPAHNKVTTIRPEALCIHSPRVESIPLGAE